MKQNYKKNQNQCIHTSILLRIQQFLLSYILQTSKINIQQYKKPTNKNTSVMFYLQMKNIQEKQDSNKQGEVSNSNEGQYPSISNILFKQHKLEELLVENKLKGLGLQTAQTLIKTLYEEMKRLQIENFQYRSQLQQINRQMKEMQKQLKREINYLRHKLDSKQREFGKKQYNRQKQRRFSQSMDYITNILIPDVSKQFSIPTSGNNLSKYNYIKNPFSPIIQMSLQQAISKQIFYNNYQPENELWNHIKRELMSNELDNILIDFDDISQFVQEQKDKLKTLQEKCIENGIQLIQRNKQMENYSRTTLTKPYNSEKSQYHTLYTTNNNKKHTIKGKKLFSTQNITESTTSPERFHFKPYFSGKCAQKKSQYSKKQKDHKSHQSEIIKEYEQIIQQYKEYSAYLKAYLCSCIGFIDKQTDQLQEENRLNKQQTQQLSEKQPLYDNPLSTGRVSVPITQRSFSNTFPDILTEILSTVSQKFSFEHEIRKQLEKENRQLKSILDELIKNLKLTGLQTNTNNRRKVYDSERENNQIKWRQKQRSKDQRNSKNNNPQISINKPITHKMTITEANNFYHSVK